MLFKPTLAQRVEGRIHLSVVNNPYEETDIQLVGEGYEDDFTLDNIHGLVADRDCLLTTPRVGTGAATQTSRPPAEEGSVDPQS